MSSMINPGKASKRWLRTAALALLVVAAAVFVIGQFTPALTAWLLRKPLSSWPFGRPPDFEAVQDSLIVEQDIVYDGEDTLLDIYRPRDAQGPLPLVLWIHGGGFIGGSKEQTRPYAMTLASRGYVVANINYDLAPEQKYPGPVLQANQALAYLQEHAGQYGADSSRIFIGSNSSGSQIASQLGALISNEEFARSMQLEPAISRQQLRGMLLYDGPYDMRSLAADPPPMIDLYLWAYTGRKDYASFERIDELSAVKHITPAYPPVFLTVGDADALEPQSLELLEVLQQNGVEVQPVLFTGTGAGLGHDYMMELDTEPAHQTLDLAIEFLEKHSQ